MNKKLSAAIIAALLIVSSVSCSKSDETQPVSENITETSVTDISAPLLSDTISDTKNTESTVINQIYEKENISVTAVPESEKEYSTAVSSNISKDNSSVAVSSVQNVSTSKAPSETAALTQKTTVTTAATTVTTVTTEAETTTTEEPEEPVGSGSASVIWLGANKDNALPGNGQLAVLTFKIRKNAPSGEQYIKLFSKDSETDYDGYYSRYDGKKKYVIFNGGKIGIGYDSSPDEDYYDGNEIYTNLTNAYGNPGDTVTIYADISNNYAGAVSCFGFDLEFNPEALQLISIEQGSIFDSIAKGSFFTTLDTENLNSAE